MNIENKGEIVVYQPNEELRLDVRVEKESVWLNVFQISQLFAREESNIRKHILNVFKEGELCKQNNVQILHVIGVKKPVPFYSLDVIISVGYRVKSLKGTQFRQWANSILKDYMLKGFAVNQRCAMFKQQIDSRLSEHECILKDHQEKIDFFVKTSLPPVQGIFYNGQIFDAYTFAADVIRSATKNVIFFDNYVDDITLQLIAKRKESVLGQIYTCHITKQLQVDLLKHNAQYKPIEIVHYSKSHDRFLLIDESVYFIGASLKDLGKKMFAFCKLEIKTNEFLAKLL